MVSGIEVFTRGMCRGSEAAQPFFRCIKHGRDSIGNSASVDEVQPRLKDGRRRGIDGKLNWKCSAVRAQHELPSRCGDS